MKGSQLLMESLKEKGIKYIFGILGREAEAILFNEEPNIKFILTRDERTAGFMADSYGRLTGKVGVCYSTFGPGATNLVTGIASAYLDRSPVLAISSQVESKEIHPSTHQCVNQVAMMKPITKYATEIKNAGEISQEVEKAINLAETERQGPVYLSIPIDFLSKEVERTEKKHYKEPEKFNKIDKEGLDCLYQEFKKSKRPIAIIGRGIIRSKASKSLEDVIEKFQIPVVSTYSGKGAIPENHPLYLGAISKYLNDLLQCKVIEKIFSNSDLIVTIGYDYAEGFKPDLWEKGKKKEIIRLDSIPNDVSDFFKPDLDIVGNVNLSLEYLACRGYRAEKRPETEKIKKFILEKKKQLFERAKSQIYPLTAPQVIEIVRKVLNPEDIFISDVGIHKQYACLFYETYLPNTFLCSNGLGSMGFGLPAAIGAKLAKPEKNVVAICGDGGFHSNSQELETASRYKLPIVCIIMQDDSFGLIKHYQLKGHNKINTSSVNFGNVDFVKLAEANGCKGYHIKTSFDLERILRIALRYSRPSVIEVPVEYDYSFGGK